MFLFLVLQEQNCSHDCLWQRLLFIETVCLTFSFFLVIHNYTTNKAHRMIFEYKFFSKCTGQNKKNQPPKGFCKKDVLKNFANFTGKHLQWSLFLIKSKAWRPATFLKKKLRNRWFPVKFKNTYFEEHLRTAVSETNFLFGSLTHVSNSGNTS